MTMWEVFNYRTGETITHTDSAFRARRVARRNDSYDYALTFGGLRMMVPPGCVVQLLDSERSAA